MKTRALSIVGALAILMGTLFFNATPAQALASYAANIKADQPTVYWRLNESTGSATFADASGNGNTGSTVGYVGRDPGAITGDASTSLSMYYANNTITTAAGYGATTYTAEAWFKTATTSGGGIVGFRQSGQAGRNVWMANSGRIVSQMTTSGGDAYVTSAKTYNDDAWHLVAVTVTPTLMTLYIDGKSAGSVALTNSVAYLVKFFAGPTDVSGKPNAPTNAQFNGSLDEVAMWSGRALSAADMERHYALGTDGYVSGAVTSVAVNPSFSFTVAGSSASCNGLTNSAGASATGTAIPLGRLTSGTRASSAQALSVGTNGTGGFAVYMRSESSTANVMASPTRPSNRIADVAVGALPGESAEAFGFTTNDVGIAMTPGNVAAVPTSASSATLLSGATGVQTRSSSVGYFASVSPTTPADTYAVTVRYTAVPNF